MLENKDLIFKNINYSIWNEFSAAIFVKDLCDNIDYLESFKERSLISVSSLDDLYIFLWFLSLQEILKEIDSFKLEEEQKQRIKALSNSVSFDDSSVVDFINNEYASIFNKNNHEKDRWAGLFIAMMNICYGRYQNRISDDVFRYLEKNYALYLLANYDVCSKYYSKHILEFESLFCGLKNTKVFDDQIYLRFLYNKSTSQTEFLKKQAAFICERTFDAVIKMNLTSDDQRLIQIQSFIVEYGRIAILYKLRCANDYAVLKKDLQQKMDSFIRKHGVHQKYGPVDLTDAINLLKSSDDNYKFLQVTHFKNERGDIENALNYILSIKNNRNPLSECFNDIQRNRSDKYPYFKQESMQINMWIRERVINDIFRDEKLCPEFVNFVYNICLEVQEKYFDNVINVEREISGVVDVFTEIINLSNQNQFDTPYARALVYSTSLSICTTIEKIIRNVALKEVKNDRYLNSDKAKLSDFFKGGYKLKDISEGLKYHLEFYLIKESKFSGNDLDKPGLNIRNNLMHGQDDAYDNTDYGICVALFYFLVSLLDDLVLSLDTNGEQENT